MELVEEPEPALGEGERRLPHLSGLGRRMDWQQRWDRRERRRSKLPPCGARSRGMSRVSCRTSSIRRAISSRAGASNRASRGRSIPQRSRTRGDDARHHELSGRPARRTRRGYRSTRRDPDPGPRPRSRRAPASVGVLGGMRLGLSARPRPRPRAWRALPRSVLPTGDRGRASRKRKAEGIMLSGRRSRRKARRAASSGSRSRGSFSKSGPGRGTAKATSRRSAVPPLSDHGALDQAGAVSAARPRSRPARCAGRGPSPGGRPAQAARGCRRAAAGRRRALLL